MNRFSSLVSTVVFAGLFMLSGCGNERPAVQDDPPSGNTPAADEVMDFAVGSGDGSSDFRPPFLKEGGKKFRIAVVVSGNYWEFFDHFKALLQGFHTLGWMKSVSWPEDVNTTEKLITYLATQSYSDFLEFPPELYFDIQWGDAKGPLVRKLLDRPAAAQTDLVLAYGGLAGQMFYGLKAYSLPVILEAITDPLAAGVIQSYEDSGKDWISCRVDPEQFKRQIRIFHDVVGFRSLGLVYGDDDFGRIYGAVRDVEAVAKERGFTLIRNTSALERLDPQTPGLYLKALEDVAQRAEAVYLGASHGVTEYNIMPKIASLLIQYRRPSFALEGGIRVRQGILYSTSLAAVTRTGLYNAKKSSLILGGAKPRSLPQLFENSPSIAVNLATAAAMGYEVPVEILTSADEIYNKIEE